jgi:hypothetical protein
VRLSVLSNVVGAGNGSGEKHAPPAWRFWRRNVHTQVTPGLASCISEEQATRSEPSSVADEQARRLVHQVFFPGWPKPAHHVLFQAADEDTDTAQVAALVARSIADRVCGITGAMDLSQGQGSLDRLLVPDSILNSADQDGAVAVPNTNNKLWVVSRNRLLGAHARSSLDIQARISELRREFDYLVLRAPAGPSSLGSLLGQFCDGVVLVVQAHVTRRAAVQKLRESLQASNVRLLGVVLSGRRSPIPEAVYRRL